MNDNTEIIKASRKKTKAGHQVELSAWDSLNNRQKLFVLEYLKTLNGTRAYKSAYPSAKNDAARAAAARLLTNANINNALHEKLDALWIEREKEAGRTLSEIYALAFSNIGDIISFKNGRMTLNDLNSIDSRAVQNVKYLQSVDGDVSIQVSMYSKNQALTLLVKILGMIKEQSEHTEDIIVIPARDPQGLLNEDEQQIS